MMKKLTALLLAACLMAGLTACSQSDSAEDTGSADAQETEAAGEADDAAAEDTAAEDAAAADAGERTTFTVGFDAEYPPYGYMDENGDYVGFDLDLAQAVCDLRGWELIKTPINWDTKDMELNSGNIDCIWNGFTMNGREGEYTFSVPYVDNRQVIVAGEDSGINALEDLAGKIVGVQTASAALDVLQGEDYADLTSSFAALQEFGDYNNAFVELQAGAIDAIAMDIGVAQYQLESRGEGFKMLDEPLNSEQYAIAFKLGNEELKDQVEESLMELVADGTFQSLAEEYGIAEYVCLTADGEASAEEAAAEEPAEEEAAEDAAAVESAEEAE